MVLVGAVEPFDELLEGPIAFGEVIEILQAQDLYQGESWLLRGAVGIEEVESGDVGRGAIGNKVQGERVGEGAGGLTQSHGGGQRVAFGSHVIGRDLVRFGIQEEEGVVMFAGHTDVSLIAGGGIPERGFMTEVEVVT